MVRRKTEPLARTEEPPSRRGDAGAFRVPPSGELDLLHLIEEDPFRQTRSRRELGRLVESVRAATRCPHAFLVKALLGSGDDLEEDAARQLWRQLVAHRDDLSRQVGRAMPLRAAAIDWLYLHQLEERPIHPLVVSRATLSTVVTRSRHDGLTGLPRRAELQRALEQARQQRPFRGGCVVMIDLDGFKRVNDTLGHQAGDAVLRRFARVARATLRQGDLVGRLGGDEFALVLHGVAPPTARRVAARLRDRFERESAAEGLSFSFGVAQLRPEEAPHLALKRADGSMFRQKRRRHREGLVEPPTRRKAGDRRSA